jgi:preprotein translocase subunit SecD
MKTLGWRAAVIAGVMLISAFLMIPSAEKRQRGQKLNLNLGLDLRGGSHLVLEVVTSDALAAETDTLAGRIMQRIRDKGITVDSVHREGNTTVLVTGIPSEKAADVDAIVSETTGSEWETSRPAPGRMTVTMTPRLVRYLEKTAVQQTLTTINNRIDQFGVVEPTIQEQGGIGEGAASRIVMQLPGVEDPSRVKDIIQTQARLEWKEMTYPPGVPEGGYIAPDTREGLIAMFGGRLPEDTEAYPHPPDPRSSQGRQTTTWWPLKKVSAIAGADLRGARRDQNRFGQPAVSFELSPDAGRRFEQITRQNVGKIMAIVLDGKVISAPVIKSVIPNGNGIIEGNFTKEEADDLSLKLKSGALPARVNIVEERTVGPSLGRDSIRRGIAAAVLGFAAVMTFMLVYYKGSGMNATLALAINVLLLLGAMSWLRATLTLPGIAGLILTVGMSVDSNVLIFERIREELALGKTVRSAIDAGFGRVWWTIVDTHVTTLASATFLFLYGTGPVRGFAVTLIIGLLASVFTAVFVSRFIYDLVLRSRKRVESLSI